MKNGQLRSFRVYPKQRPDFGSVINHFSPGQAKSEYLPDLQDAWPEFNYTDLRCTVVGKPHTNSEFIRCAKYRGVPFARCGMLVEVDGVRGFIVGHNRSANFNVLFVDGDYKDQTHNCHPNWKMKYFDQEGKEIHQP